MAKSRDGYRYREGQLYCWAKMIGGERIVVKARSHGAREKRIKERLAEHAAGKPLDPQSVKAFMASWLDTHVKPNRAYKTHKSYAQMIRSHVEPTLGETKIALVTSADLQKILNRMTEGEIVDGKVEGALSPRTVQYMRVILGLAFAQAKAEGLVGLNPATRLSAPAMRSKAKRILTDNEAKALLAYRGTRFSPLFGFLLSTGLRVSEALAIRDADVGKSAVRVEHQIEWRKDGAFSFATLKTSAARRAVPLSAVALDAIERAQAQRASDIAAAKSGYTPYGLIFATESGRPSTPSNVHRALRAALVELKLAPASVHDLRRTFLTRLARVESRAQILKAIAGHTSLSTTMQFYVASNAEDEIGAVTRAMQSIM